MIGARNEAFRFFSAWAAWFARRARPVRCGRVTSRPTAPHRPLLARAAALLLACAIGAAGCSVAESIALHFPIFDPPCHTGSADRYPSLGENTYSLRLTFMQREADPIASTSIRHYKLICDQMIAPSEDLELQVPLGGGRFTVAVEAFNTAEELVYSGQVEGVDLSAKSTQSVTVPLRSVQKLSCVPAALHYRAFHSATLLPNGQVLLAGGIVADATDGKALYTGAADTAHATAKTEIFDPDTQRFFDVSGPIPPRAFHQAVLLPSRPVEGPFRVLLLGGIRPQSAGEAAVVMRVITKKPFLFSPYETASAAPAALIEVTPSASGGAPALSYRELPDLPRALFPVVTLSASGDAIVMAGGASAYTDDGTTVGFTADSPTTWLDPEDIEATAAPSVDLRRVRVGHAAAPLAYSQQLVFGGGMDGPDDPTSEQTTVAELLSNQDAAPSTTLVGFSTPPDSTAWHTLTPIGVPDREMAQTGPRALLLAGGFPLTYESNALRFADDQTLATPLQLISAGPPITIEEVTGTAAGDFRSGGYHDAIRLADGRVLLTGGNVNSSFVSGSCSQSTIFCALKQLAIYARVSATGKAALETLGPSALQVARFGHRSTRLLDNTVLITGGVTWTGSAAELTNVTELLNPRRGESEEDPFERNKAKTYHQSHKPQDLTCSSYPIEH